MRARQRAVAPALAWGREPRGAGRGQTGPKGTQNPKRALRRSALGAAGPNHGKKNQPPRATGRARVARGPRGAPCESKPRRADLLWLTWRPAEAHAAALLCSGCLPWPLLQKRMPPCCCALAVDVAPWPLCSCRSARRRAAVLWLLTWRHADAHAAVLLCPRAANARALQEQTPPCCFALAGVAPDRSARRRAAAPCQAWRGAGRLAKAVFLIHREGGRRRLGCARGDLRAP